MSNPTPDLDAQIAATRDADDVRPFQPRADGELSPDLARERREVRIARALEALAAKPTS